MRTIFWRETNTSLKTDPKNDTTGRKTTGLSIILSLFALLTNPATMEANVWYSGEFSADIILTNPSDPQNKVRSTFYVGKDRFRAENIHQNQLKVLIVHPNDHKIWMLFPEDRTYYVGPGRTPIPPKPDKERLPGDSNSPCQQDKALSCSQIGSETLGGIPTEKWEIIHHGQIPTNAESHEPQRPTRKVNLWIDPSRHIIIRQQPEQGPVMERSLVAVENINGRQTEKWAFVLSFRGKTQKSLQWVDVKLRVPVREEEAGKIMMELVNIKENHQPANLFEIPRTFRKIQPPFRSQQQGQPGQRRTQQPPPAQPGKLQYH